MIRQSKIDPEADLMANQDNAIDSWFIVSKVLAKMAMSFFYVSCNVRFIKKPFMPGITIAVNSITNYLGTGYIFF